MDDGSTLTSVVVIALVAALTPILAAQLGRWVAVSATVLEIGFGILIGPAVLGLARTDTVVDAMSSFGLALLFFLAGYEVSAGEVRGRPLRRAVLSWAASLLLGLAVGVVLAGLLGGSGQAGLVLGLALATTALGAILPMVRDAGVLSTPLGQSIMAVGAVGEFGPVVAIALLLSGERPLHATALLLAFAAVALASAWLAARRAPVLARPMSATLGSSGQFAVRLAMLAVLALVWLALELHLDLVLGAFAAGMVMRVVLAAISREEATVVESKLEGVGFGLLIPFFFITTGVRFELSALLASPTALLLVPVGLLGFLLVRGLPTVLAFRSLLPGRQVVGLGLYAATALPVVVTDLAVANGWLTAADAAGMVGAAVLSVLIYPTLASRSR